MLTEQDLVRHLSEASVSVELETPEMTLNIGPQHPSTHGVLRLVARVDGERAFDVTPVIGYMHRGYEKLSEVRTYPQITALINRIDWVSGYANEVPFIVAAEKLMEIEVPERAQYIRLILTEMARISSHLVFMASYPLELGAATPLFFALRERERVLDLLESVTGGRFHPNFNRIGGVKPAYGSGSGTRKLIQDLPAGFYAETSGNSPLGARLELGAMNTGLFPPPGKPMVILRSPEGVTNLGRFDLQDGLVVYPNGQSALVDVAGPYWRGKVRLDHEVAGVPTIVQRPPGTSPIQVETP